MVNLQELKRPAKILAFGDYGTGKSTFALSVIKYWKRKGYKPEECLMHILDLDDGMEPLFYEVDPEYLPSIRFNLATDWNDLTAKSTKAVQEVKAWMAKYGHDRALLIIDNTGFAWNWAQDQFTLDVYGKPLHELMAEKRAQAIAEQRKFIPTLDGMKDWPTITKMHSAWADTIKMSGINFIWLAPRSDWDQENEDGTKTTLVKAKGQKDNPGRVDHILLLYTEGEGDKMTYWADLKKNRNSKDPLFRRMQDPTYGKLKGWLEKMEVQQRERLKPKPIAVPAVQATAVPAVDVIEPPKQPTEEAKPSA